MATFCLPPDKTKAFLQALKSGEINPEQLAEMTSKQRREFLTEFVGEKFAKEVNALFESKLLLKNQQQGMITWAKKVSGITPKTRTDMLSKIEKMNKVLDPEEESMFLKDLADKKLGTDITVEEAQKITTLAHETAQAKESLPPLDEPNFMDDPRRLEYGRKLVDLQDYVNDLKDQAQKLTLHDFKTNPAESIGKSVTNFAGLTKSLKASLDNSVIGRQGLKTLFAHPKIWAKNAKQTFADMYNTYKGKNVMREIRADVQSRPNALNGLYKDEKLAVGVIEEAYPTNLPEKIPGIGRVFKASENAFVGFQYRTRADLFDKYVEIANKTGADIKGIGKVANAMTGRGSLGRLEPVANVVNNIFFSPRFVKSNIDLLTAHALDKGIGSFARKQAALNTIKVIAGVATVLGIAEAINPKSVEFDPRSADFGKIKIGNTRFDVSGGMSGLVVLAKRALSQSTKSSVTGEIKELNTGEFGSDTVGDVLGQFTGNKLSPVMSVVRDVFLRGTDSKGNKPTVGGEAVNLLAPIGVTTFAELQNDPKSANIIAAMIAEVFGISVNTYGKKK